MKNSGLTKETIKPISNREKPMFKILSAKSLENQNLRIETGLIKILVKSPLWITPAKSMVLEEKTIVNYTNSRDKYYKTTEKGHTLLDDINKILFYFK